MTNQPATRMELLLVKKRKKLAEKGHSLLKKKRDALIRIFFDYIKEYKELKERTTAKLKEAYEELHIAQGVSGVSRVKSLAFSADPTFALDFSRKNVMGVRVPKIDVKHIDGGRNASPIGISYHVADTIEHFRKVVVDLVKLAEVEQSILLLAEEITKTKRRVNALEYIQIPKLTDTQKTIKNRLAEIEREEFSRLKHVKKQMENAA